MPDQPEVERHAHHRGGRHGRRFLRRNLHAGGGPDRARASSSTPPRSPSATFRPGRRPGPPRLAAERRPCPPVPRRTRAFAAPWVRRSAPVRSRFRSNPPPIRSRRSASSATASRPGAATAARPVAPEFVLTAEAAGVVALQRATGVVTIEHYLIGPAVGTPRRGPLPVRRHVCCHRPVVTSIMANMMRCRTPMIRSMVVAVLLGIAAVAVDRVRASRRRDRPGGDLGPAPDRGRNADDRRSDRPQPRHRVRLVPDARPAPQRRSRTPDRSSLVRLRARHLRHRRRRGPGDSGHVHRSRGHRRRRLPRPRHGPTRPRRTRDIRCPGWRRVATKLYFTVPPAPESSSSGLPIGVVLGGVALVVVLVGGFLLYRRSGIRLSVTRVSLTIPTFTTSSSSRPTSGITPLTVVPRPGADHTSSDPPSASTRSPASSRPSPRGIVAGSNPTPSSATHERHRIARNVHLEDDLNTGAGMHRNVVEGLCTTRIHRLRQFDVEAVCLDRQRRRRPVDAARPGSADANPFVATLAGYRPRARARNSSIARSSSLLATTRAASASAVRSRAAARPARSMPNRAARSRSWTPPRSWRSSRFRPATAPSSRRLRDVRNELRA